MTITKSKLGVAVFGAAQIKGQPDSVSTMLLGVIGGVATGLFPAKAQDGLTDIWGLKGQFFAQVLRTAMKDGEGGVKAGEKYVELVESGKCYMPDHIQMNMEELFLGKIKTVDGVEQYHDEDKKKPIYEVDPIGSLEFGYKVHVERAKNKAGYTYAFEAVKEVAENDPLASQKADAMKALGLTPAAPAIADKSKK